MPTKRPSADDLFAAIKALPKFQRDAVLVRIARDRSMRRDLADLSVIAERRSEPSRPFRSYLAEKGTR